MTKLELCSITDDERIVKSENGQNFEMFYRPKMFRLNAKTANEIQVLIEMEPELELFLNVGTVRNDNYIGLYMNLTSFDLYAAGTFNNSSSIDSAINNKDQMDYEEPVNTNDLPRLGD